MVKIEEILEKNKGKKCAVYGLGAETDKFLHKYGEVLNIVGLLDGFRENGEIYGHPIISIQNAVGEEIAFIIVVARPAACKVIAKRIGDICRKNSILLFDVRGKDLLAAQTVSYDFNQINGESKDCLLEKIERADIVSFDLFDTLLMRKTLSYTDLFNLLEKKLAEQGIYIPDFARLRLFSEKELSKGHAPKLVEIYEEVSRRAGGSFLTAEELAEMEWELDCSVLLPRYSVCDIFTEMVHKGKRVVITTDSYYRENQIRQILSMFKLGGYEKLLVSCERGTSKSQGLFEFLKGMSDSDAGEILHIGDDETADVEYAEKNNIVPFRVYSGISLFDMLGELGMEKELISLSDRVKAGLFISRIFNDPFVFEEGSRKLTVSDSFDIGYLFCAPVITDFSIWLSKRVRQENISQILFCARDGFLVGRLFRKIDRNIKSFYFLTSRTAAIRAGVENDEDISYIDSMNFSGTEEDNLRVRFGIQASDIRRDRSRNKVILNRSGMLRKNYKKYIGKLGIEMEESALFDFVAKGTTQMYLKRLFEKHIKGFYFLQLDPEFMEDKGLDIEAFYSDEERQGNAIFDYYYILETIITSPYPTIEEFDGEGNPVYSQELRSEQDIRCLKRAQDGIASYFDDYISILPVKERTQNKRLDEILFSLMNCIRIEDKDFMSLKVEDLFFGRVIPITDVI